MDFGTKSRWRMPQLCLKGTPFFHCKTVFKRNQKQKASGFGLMLVYSLMLTITEEFVHN